MPAHQHAAARKTKSTRAKSAGTTKRRSDSKRKTTSGRRWSARVTRQSDALTLEDKVFTRTPIEIARSLKRSAERSRRRKSSPYRSAMSMLTFYVNRAGKNLSAAKRRKLEAAKEQLRALFQRARSGGAKSGSAKSKTVRSGHTKSGSARTARAKAG